MIKVTTFTYEDLDDLYANTYVLSDDDNNCVVIDPSNNNLSVVNFIDKNSLNLKAIFITHGHVDHIKGAEILVSHYNVPLYIGFYDADKLKDPYQNCSMFLGNPVILEIDYQTVADKEVLRLLKEDIEVIETPYHTSGSVCYYLRDSHLLFTGDFILQYSVGRCDLPSSQPRELEKSLSKILVLPKKTKIYAGHGKSSTIGEELLLNPFIRR
ncbi:MAG TPA: MBL fold metallo-hydrolase [Erysipelotrichaceae bacterium]|nr:MBL fold metallo-hydrolase [Erysipelotrichaceae bacterium]